MRLNSLSINSLLVLNVGFLIWTFIIKTILQFKYLCRVVWDTFVFYLIPHIILWVLLHLDVIIKYPDSDIHDVRVVSFGGSGLVCGKINVTWFKKQFTLLLDWKCPNTEKRLGNRTIDLSIPDVSSPRNVRRVTSSKTWGNTPRYT